MRIRSLLLPLCLVSLATLHAEPATEATAKKVVSIMNVPGNMRTGVDAALQPLYAQLKGSGAPDAAIEDMKKAINEWFEAEVKWTELEPKVVAIYQSEYTEEDLKALVAFYESPVGKKTLEKMPSTMQKTTAVMQEYMGAKQASLSSKIQAVMQKHQPKAPAAAPDKK